MRGKLEIRRDLRHLLGRDLKSRPKPEIPFVFTTQLRGLVVGHRPGDLFGQFRPHPSPEAFWRAGRRHFVGWNSDNLQPEIDNRQPILRRKPMTSYERFASALSRIPVDKLPVVVRPMAGNDRSMAKRGRYWCGSGRMPEHFGQDFCDPAGWLDSCANLDYKPEVIEETDKTILTPGMVTARCFAGTSCTIAPRNTSISPSRTGTARSSKSNRFCWRSTDAAFLSSFIAPRGPMRQRSRSSSVWGGVAPLENGYTPVCRA